MLELREAFFTLGPSMFMCVMIFDFLRGLQTRLYNYTIFLISITVLKNSISCKKSTAFLKKVEIENFEIFEGKKVTSA